MWSVDSIEIRITPRIIVKNWHNADNLFYMRDSTDALEVNTLHNSACSLVRLSETVMNMASRLV